MQWNDFDYQIQLKVLDRLGDLMLKEENEALQFAMAAAIVELELWSNAPPRNLDENGRYIAQATDGDFNDNDY